MVDVYGKIKGTNKVVVVMQANTESEAEKFCESWGWSYDDGKHSYLLSIATEECKEVTSEAINEIIAKREPNGLYYHFDAKVNAYVGLDNTTQDAWVEEFINLAECKKWLFGLPCVDRFGVEHNC